MKIRSSSLLSIFYSVLCLFFSATSGYSHSYSLDADPNYSFAITTRQPTAGEMAVAIQARLGKPVTVVSSLTNANTAYSPTRGDTGVSPFYIYGPGPNGIVENLNLQSSIITGLVTAQLLQSGTDTIGGVSFNRYICRVFSATQFFDCLVKVVGFSGNSSSYAAVWSFYQNSGPRAIGGAIVNLSARANVLTGDNIEICGFIINGSGNKRVVVRGLGPSLGISGQLADPVLYLYDSSGSLIYSNNNWKDSQQTDIQATGLQPSNDLDSAIVITLNPGAYTAIVVGNGGGTGIGLCEVYEVSGTAVLANLSARAYVGTGNSILITGLIVTATNSGPEIVIRVLGPTFNGILSSPLQNPTLELYNSSGTLIAYNDNWQDSQYSDIQASGYAPPNYYEPAILTNLVPGAYTAIVRGYGSTTGTALAEVYKIQ